MTVAPPPFDRKISLLRLEMEEGHLTVSFDQVASSLIKVGSSMLLSNQPTVMIAALERAVRLMSSLSESLQQQQQQYQSSNLDMSTSVSFPSDYVDSFFTTPSDDMLFEMKQEEEEEEPMSSIEPVFFDSSSVPVQSSPLASRARRERRPARRFIETMPGEPLPIKKRTKTAKKQNPRRSLFLPMVTNPFKPVPKRLLEPNRILGPTGRYMSLDYYNSVLSNAGE